MGAKTRSNYAPGYSMTDEDFNRIFRKEPKDESAREEEREREDNLGTVDEKSETVHGQGTECEGRGSAEQTDSEDGTGDPGTSS